MLMTRSNPEFSTFRSSGFPLIRINAEGVVVKMIFGGLILSRSACALPLSMAAVSASKRSSSIRAGIHLPKS